jgi:hypothetical protein
MNNARGMQNLDGSQTLARNLPDDRRLPHLQSRAESSRPHLPVTSAPLSFLSVCHVS